GGGEEGFVAQRISIGGEHVPSLAGFQSGSGYRNEPKLLPQALGYRPNVLGEAEGDFAGSLNDGRASGPREIFKPLRNGDDAVSSWAVRLVRARTQPLGFSEPQVSTSL